jgi:hypothetical protein
MEPCQGSDGVSNTPYHTTKGTSMHIHIRKAEDGDWVQVIVDGKFRYSGHSIPSFIWEKLLEEAGCTLELETNLTEDELTRYEYS